MDWLQNATLWPSIFLAIVLILINESTAQTILDCTKMNNNAQNPNQNELDLTFDGVIESFQQFNFVRIISTSNIKNNANLKKTYIDANLTDDGQLLVFTTANFPTYAHEQTDTIIRLQVEYECIGAATKIWYFYQVIKTDNYYAPVFSLDDYKISVPLPLYRGLDLSYFQEIFAHDDDLVNNAISFSSPDAENFMIKVGTSDVVGNNGKTHYATINLMKVLLSISEPIEFTIIATDSGKPPKSSNATVTIMRDIENSLPPQPQFSKLIYDFQLDSDLKLAITEPIVLKETTYSELVTFEIAGDDAKLFLIEPVLNEIDVKLSRELTKEDIDNKLYFQFNIIAINSQLNETGNSGVIIGITATNQDGASYFGKTLYWGEIIDSQLDVEEIHFNTLIDEDDIKFSLNNADSMYFDITVHENVIQLVLRPNIDENQWANKSFLSVKVLADYKSEIIATTEVIIDTQISHHKFSFQFQKILYIGNIESSSSKLDLETIEIISEDITLLNRLTIHLEGNDSELFKFEYFENELRLSLIENITDKSWNGKSMLSLSIVATDPIDMTVASTGIVLQILNNSSAIPSFEKTLYTGDMNGMELNLESIHIDLGVLNNEKINYSLQNMDAKFFDIINDENEIQVTLKPDADENQWVNKSFLSLKVVASFETEIIATTEVIIGIQRKLNSLNFQFEKILYVGKTDINAQLTLETIGFKSEDGAVLNRLTISLQGDNSDLFKYEYVANEVRLSFRNGVTEDNFKGKSILSLRIIATDQIDFTTATTGVIIQIISNGSSTPQPDPCPTPEPPSDIPVFETDLYLYSVKPNFIGTIGVVRASISSSAASITYKVLVINDHLISRISINGVSGELSITSIVSPGIYVFQVIAINDDNNSKSSATVRLEIDSIVQCDNQTFVASSLIIKRLEEMKIYDEIMKTTYENCEFEIFDEYPLTEPKFFSINQASKMIVSRQFNREDPLFDSMIVPQIQLRLKLKCPETVIIEEESNEVILNRYRRDANDDNNLIMVNKSLIFTDDIPFKIDETLLNIIIIDINDNYPEFIVPPIRNFVIGYPDKEIASDLLPDYLTKIEAFDIDEGINATIYYKIDDNDHFAIESSTGIIYPFKNAMVSINTLTLNIHATDRNGSNDGLTTSTSIIVKKISSDQIILLTFEINDLNEKIQNLLMQIERKANVKLVPIKHAIVPNDDENLFKIAIRSLMRNKRSEDGFILKVWAYAFDDNEIPIETSDIKTKLTTVEDELKLSTESYEDTRKSEIHNGNLVTNSTGYIAAVSLLSIISVGCIVFIAWWFYGRNYEFNKTKTAHSGTLGAPFMAKLQTEIEYKKSIGDGTDYGPELSHYQKRESIKIFGITKNETSDETQKNQSNKQLSLSDQSRTSDSANETSSVKSDSNSTDDDKPNKTTVTFNEMVERIDIESEDETQPNTNNWEATSQF